MHQNVSYSLHFSPRYFLMAFLYFYWDGACSFTDGGELKCYSTYRPGIIHERLEGHARSKILHISSASQDIFDTFLPGSRRHGLPPARPAL